MDTSFAIALAVKSDAHHDQAVEWSEQLDTDKTNLITTTAILLEIGNALSKKRHRKAAVTLLDSLHRDPSVKIVSIDNDLYFRGFELFGNRADKVWGLIDCISFVVMQENDLVEALTADQHFRQSGFVPLLGAG